MWVNGKEVHGELVPADKAREVYTSIVRQTKDPGLLEYIGNNFLRMRVFPIPAKGDQKVSFSYESVADKRWARGGPGLALAAGRAVGPATGGCRHRPRISD
jgi:hypothetical protein